MADATKQTATSRSLGARLWWLILGRAATAVLLLLLGAFWRHNTLESSLSTSLRRVAPILWAVAALTVIYSATHLLWKNYLAQSRFQFFADMLLVTWLVWATGDLHSPYTALYIVVISVSSLFIGPRGALITSLGSAVAFNACTLLALNGIGPVANRAVSNESLANAIQSMGLSDVSFLVVGLLAAKLAERQLRADVQLAAATRSLADLRALHERIVESIRSGVVTTDLQGRIYTFNAAAAEITGYKEEDVRGQDASIFFGEMKGIIADSLGASSAAEPSPRFEADCLTADGLRLRLGFSISPLFSETGDNTGTVIT